MKIDNATSSWLSVTTAAREIWYCHSGDILIDTDAVEANRAGVLLRPFSSIEFASGQTVYYKLAAGTPLIGRVALL